MKTKPASIFLLSILIPITGTATPPMNLVDGPAKINLAKIFTSTDARTIIEQSDQIFKPAQSSRYIFFGETALDDGAKCFIATGHSEANLTGNIDNVYYFVPNNQSGSWGCTEIKSVKFLDYKGKNAALIMAGATAMARGDNEFNTFSIFYIDLKTGKSEEIKEINDFIYKRDGELSSPSGQKKFISVNSMHKYLIDNDMIK